LKFLWILGFEVWSFKKAVTSSRFPTTYATI